MVDSGQIKQIEADKRAQQILERRNTAFRILYDTVFEVEGASDEKTFSVLCHNLRRICAADYAALALYNPIKQTMSLEAIDVDEGSYNSDGLSGRIGDVCPLPSFAYDHLVDSQVKKCLHHDICVMDDLRHMLLCGIPDDGLIYRLSCVREGELVAAVMVHISDSKTLKMKDIVDTYLNLAGMIIQRVNMVRALRESEERFRSVVHTASDAIIAMDEDCNIRLWNAAAESMFGYNSEDICGRSLGILIGEDFLEQQAFDALIGNSFERSSGTSHTVEFVGHRKGGGCFPVELSLGSWSCRNGMFYTLIIRDITERKQMEYKLIQSQKMESVGQLASGIAHEINTPAQYIGDNTRYLRDSFNDLTKLLEQHGRVLDSARDQGLCLDLLAEVDEVKTKLDIDFLLEDIPKSLEQTIDGIEHVTKIVQAMKSFSQPGVEEKALLDLNRAIETTLEVSRNYWKYIAEIELALDENLPLISALPGEINQVLLNLILNAASAIEDSVSVESGEKGLISISTARDGNSVEIRISDTGVGIADDVKDKIFDPFFTTKAVGSGVGNGLSICHDVIVNKHCGEINFATAIGKGTAFTVNLPIHCNCKSSS